MAMPPPRPGTTPGMERKERQRWIVRKCEGQTVESDGLKIRHRCDTQASPAAGGKIQADLPLDHSRGGGGSSADRRAGRNLIRSYRCRRADEPQGHCYRGQYVPKQC